MEPGRMKYKTNTFVMNEGKTLDDATNEAATEAFNKAVKKREEQMNAHIERELEAGRKMTAKMDSMEIVPMTRYVLVRPYEKNPFEALEEKGGIIIAKPDGSFKNPDTGEEDTEYNFSVQADVIEVGPECTYVKEGDVVYYRRACGVPIPFFRQGFEVVDERQIHVVINEHVKERFEKLKENDRK